jgi:hypothetical protein
MRSKNWSFTVSDVSEAVEKDIRAVRQDLRRKKFSLTSLLSLSAYVMGCYLAKEAGNGLQGDMAGRVEGGSGVRKGAKAATKTPPGVPARKRSHPGVDG